MHIGNCEGNCDKTMGRGRELLNERLKAYGTTEDYRTLTETGGGVESIQEGNKNRLGYTFYFRLEKLTKRIPLGDKNERSVAGIIVGRLFRLQTKKPLFFH